MTRIFICVNDVSIIQKIMQYEDFPHNIQIVGITTNIIEDVEELVDLFVDVMLLQNTLDDNKYVTMLEMMKTHDKLKQIKLLPIFKELDGPSIHLMLHLDIYDFILEPFSTQQLASMLNVQLGGVNEEQGKWNIEIIASTLLAEIGLPNHLYGFPYLQSSAIIVARNYVGRKAKIGHVYEETARKYHTTASRVEKAIRTAINYAYRTQPEKICIYNNKPTNSQIILYISDKLKLYETIHV
ncbi:MAG: sporulation initiation factor Spo0A C-terminal domain-containing protein [Longicatena sp.]